MIIKKLATYIVCSTVLYGLLSAAYATDTLPNQSPQLDHQWIIKLRNNSSESLSTSTQALAKLVAADTSAALAIKSSSHTNEHIISLPYAMSGVEAKQYLTQFIDSDDLLYAEPNNYRYPLTSVDISDPYFFLSQTYLADPESHKAALNLYNAWGITRGSKQVPIAVIDTGAVNHIDLYGRFPNKNIKLAGYDFISHANNALDGDGRDSNPMDTAISNNWHGTSVAGVLGAHSNNAQGITGVTWDNPILIARALGKNGGLISDIADAIRWSAGLKVNGVPDNPTPAKVINLSFGADGQCSHTEQSAINDAVKAGAVIVVAAGNENENTSNKVPANCENVITVGALTAQAERVGFSNFGDEVDISTLGIGLYTLQSISGYTYAAGTSFATPLVSGVIALMLSANENLVNGKVAPASIASLIEDKLKANSRPFDANTSCQKFKCGKGILDAHQAIKAVSTPPIAEAGNNVVATSGHLTEVLGFAHVPTLPNSTIKEYRWTQLEGQTQSLHPTAQSKSLLFRPDLNNGTLTFALEATNDVGLSSQADSVKVFVVPQFLTQYNTPLNSWRESNSIRIDTPTTLHSIQDGQYRINHGSYTDTTPISLQTGDILTLAHNSSAQPNTTQTTRITFDHDASTTFTTRSVTGIDSDQDGIADTLDKYPKDASQSTLLLANNMLSELKANNFSAFETIKVLPYDQKIMPDLPDTLTPYSEVLQFSINDLSANEQLSISLSFGEDLPEGIHIYYLGKTKSTLVNNVVFEKRQLTIPLKDNNFDFNALADGKLTTRLILMKSSVINTSSSDTEQPTNPQPESGSGGGVISISLLFLLLSLFLNHLSFIRKRITFFRKMNFK